MFKFKFGPVILFVLSAFFIGLSIKYKAATAFIYTDIINKAIREKISLVTNKLDISISEILIIILILLIILFIANFIRNLFRPKKWLPYIIRVFWGGFNISSIVLFIYVLVFCLNYHTPMLGDIIIQKYNTKYSTNINVNVDSSKRIDIFKYILEKTTESKKILVSSEKVNFDNLEEMNRQAIVGYNVISEAFPTLSGNYSKPKKSFYSDGMSFFGLDARYSIFMNEITINENIPKEYMPFILCKYMAYQRGVAREDEASFYAYLACINNPDIRFKYSGYLAMIGMVSESLRVNDKMDFNANINLLDNDIKKDINNFDRYREEYGSGKYFTNNFNYYFKRLNGDIRVDFVDNQVTNLVCIYYSLFPYN